MPDKESGVDNWHLNRERELAALRAEQANLGKRINLIEQLIQLERDYCPETQHAAQPAAPVERPARPRPSKPKRRKVLTSSL